jgi:ribosomal protein S18 acetylase RimI-like enzyme
MSLERTLEECALNAWPALQERVYDGWLLRFAEGFTRRSNSVNSVYEGTLVVRDKIARCEAAYRERGQPCVFKLTPLARPAGLDELLASRGYRQGGRTSAMLLETIPLPAGDAGEASLVAPTEPLWWENFARLAGTSPRHQGALRGILERIPGAHIGIVLNRGGQVVSCGRAVLEDELVGFYDLATDPGHRRQGLAGRLIRHLLSWAVERGARGAYLQVEVENTPARHLYESMGFREVYRYWYRTR